MAQPLPPRDEIAAHHLIDETRLVDRLIERAVFSEDERRRFADSPAGSSTPRAREPRASTPASMPSCASTGCQAKRASS